MADTLANLVVRLTAQNTDLLRKFDQAEKRRAKFHTGIVKLGAVLGAGFGMQRAARFIINTNREFERLNAQLLTVTGSQRAATAAFADLEKFARDTPFQIENNTQAFIRLKALGIDPTIERMTNFGNLASAFGRDIVDVARAVQGAVTGETEALKAFGITSRIQGDRITFAFQGVETTVKRTTGSVVSALEEIAAANFAGAMANEMETLNGQLSNFQDNMGELARTMGTVLLPPMTKFVELLNRAASSIAADLSTNPNQTIRQQAARVAALAASSNIGVEEAALRALLSERRLAMANAAAAGGGGMSQGRVLMGPAGRGGVAGIGAGAGVRMPGAPSPTQALMMARSLQDVGDAFSVVDVQANLLDHNLRGMVGAMEEASAKSIQLGGVIVSSIAAAIQSIISGGGLGGFIGSLSAGIGGIVGLGNPLLGLGIAAGGGLLASAIGGGRDDPVRVNLVDISDRALDKQNVRDPVTNIFFAGQQVSSGNVADTLAQIREYERRTGVKVTSG